MKIRTKKAKLSFYLKLLFVDVFFQPFQAAIVYHSFLYNT